MREVLKMKTSVLVFTIVLVACCLSSASFAQKAQKQSRRGVGIEPDRIIPYKTIGDVTLSLHVFEPDIRKATPPFSAIVFFFGGGWRTGSPRQFYGQCQYLARRGMVAISAEYRIESTHGTSPFECIADAKSALRFLRANAESFKVDPNRIVASGGSAGGHIAACSGIIPGLESDGENLDISSVPNALVLFNPVVMLTDGKSNLIGKFSGRPLEASPHHFVREGLPPTIIFHGKEDRLIPYWTIEEFARKMQENGNVCQVVGFEGVGHGFFNEASSPDSPNQKTIRLTDEFLVSLGMIPSATRVLH